MFLLTHIPPRELSTNGLRIEFRHRVNTSRDFAEWVEIVKLLIKRANLNARNNLGRTLLLTASTKEIATLLMKNGANISDRY